MFTQREPMKGLESRGKRAGRTGQRGANVVLHYSRQGILSYELEQFVSLINIMGVAAAERSQ